MTGRKLIRLLLDDGWTIKRPSAHGRWLQKVVNGQTRYTTVKDTRKEIPPGLLAAILGPKQTGLGNEGLTALEQRDKPSRVG